MARDRIGKIENAASKCATGRNFKADTPHEAYPTPGAYRRMVNRYFEYCDMHGEHYTLPGLALFLGLRSKSLQQYDADGPLIEYRRITDYAFQKIEAHIAQMFFVTKGSTKGIEFLAQNSLGYSSKSDVNSKQSVEVTEREKLKAIPDEELHGRILNLVPRLQEAAEEQNKRVVIK